LLDGTQWLLMQLLFTHSALLLQLAPLSAAQLGTAELHFPDAHTAVASEHIPVCKPSVGMVVPAGN
jgi:hypothetical protein